MSFPLTWACCWFSDMFVIRRKALHFKKGGRKSQFPPVPPCFSSLHAIALGFSSHQMAPTTTPQTPSLAPASLPPFILPTAYTLTLPGNALAPQTPNTPSGVNNLSLLLPASCLILPVLVSCTAFTPNWKFHVGLDSLTSSTVTGLL